MYIQKLASQIRNDIVSGLRGYHQNLSLNMRLLEDEIVDCRLAIIELQFLQGKLPIQDLLIAINCIDVDCESLERCKCRTKGNDSTQVLHFQIPQVMYNFGKQAIDYIGSADRQNKFTVITSLAELENRQYRKRGQNKPYVWIDFAPNQAGMLDCFVFNAPMLKLVSVVGVFKDPRQIELFGCCNQKNNPYSLTGPDNNVTYISQLVKEKLTKEKLYYYRQLAAPLSPNDQTYKTGN